MDCSSSENPIKNILSEKQTVETPIGEIEITPVTDPVFPGVYISINGEDFVLVEFDDLQKKHVIRVWDEKTPDEDPEYVQLLNS